MNNPLSESAKSQLKNSCKLRQDNFMELRQKVEKECGGVGPFKNSNKDQSKANDIKQVYDTIINDFSDKIREARNFNICNNHSVFRYGQYGESLRIDFKITQCDTINFGTSNYELGEIISQSAVFVYDLLLNLFKGIKDDKTIVADTINISITGLADATTLEDGSINIKYCNDKIPDIELKRITNFEVKLIDIEKNILDTLNINLEINDYIITNEQLAAVRSFLVVDRIKSLSEKPLIKFDCYIFVGNKNMDPINRGVDIKIEFPKAFEYVLKLEEKDDYELDIIQWIWEKQQKEKK